MLLKTLQPQVQLLLQTPCLLSHFIGQTVMNGFNNPPCTSYIILLLSQLTQDNTRKMDYLVEFTFSDDLDFVMLVII